MNIYYEYNFYMQVRSEENKKLFTARKKEIQEKFRSEMGLLVDVVLQGIFYYILKYIQITTFQLIN
jgi:hypothetical protein